MAKKEYTKLTGRGRSWKTMGTWTTLWKGTDHLLHVQSSGYTEEYKRFFYADIQGIVIRKTNSARNSQIFLTVLIVLVVAAAISVSNPVWRGFYIFFAAFFGLLLLIDLLRGPSCNCQIQTAVQVEELSSLARVRRARKKIALIQREIVAAQGTMTPEEIRERLRQSSNVPPAPPRAAAPPPLPGRGSSAMPPPL